MSTTQSEGTIERVCRVPECGRQVAAHGLCSLHDHRVKAGRVMWPEAR